MAYHSVGAQGLPEVKLWADKKDREMWENFADLFAIIKTTEKLEKAYVRDAISANDYEVACKKLITQFKTLRTTLKDSVPDVERFMKTYNMDCPAAVNRLLVIGIPATLEHGKATPNEGGGSAAAVAETVQHFITAMDSLKLYLVACDQLFPLLSDLLGSLNRVHTLPNDFEGREKVKEWLSKMNRMAASDELTESQVRQLSFDLESAYQAFLNSLPSHNR